MKKDKITMYGAQWCPDCRRTKEFLESNQISFDYVNVDVSKEASSLVESINNGKRIIPTLLINDKPYSNPQNHQLAGLLGINKQGRITLFGTEWCQDCRKVKRFLQDNQLHFRFIDIDKSPEAAEYITRVNNGKKTIPVLEINGKAVSDTSLENLNKLFELDKTAEERIYDVIIIGGGAAGLTTAIYSQRDKYDILILEKRNIGGNAYITQKIENYPGFKEVTGPELMERMADQAITLGAKIETGIEVSGIEKTEQFFKVHTHNNTYKGKTIVVAAGSTYRLLNIPGEAELIGSGVHFCATCDGAFYREKEVIVVGGGNSALEEGMFLAGFCKKVTIVHRSPAFAATETYLEKLSGFKNIEVKLNTTVTELISNERGEFEAALLKNNQTGETSMLKADGVFIFAGLVPNTQSFESVLSLSQSKHILTKGLNKTNVDGIFAAGDCRHGAIAQVAAATGEGVVASYGVREFLSQ